MSRSFVARTWPWNATATPPMTTKSTSARARRPSRASSRSSGKLATASRAGDREAPHVRSVPLQGAQPLGRGQFELLADQGLVHARRPRGRGKLEVMAGRAQYPV